MLTDCFNQLMKEFSRWELFDEFRIVLAVHVINLSLKVKMSDMNQKGSRCERIAKKVNKTTLADIKGIANKITPEQVDKICGIIHDFDIRMSMHGAGGCKEPNVKETFEELVAILHPDR